MVNPDGAGSFEGYYNNPEANARAHARRHVLDRRPRLPRRRRLLLLRGPQLRLAARRRRELRGRAGRAGDLPPSRRRARRGLRGAVAGGRRRGDGRRCTCTTARRSTPTGSSRSSARSRTSRRSGCPRFVRISHGLPSTATQKVLKRVLAARALGVRRRGVVASRPRARVPAARRRRRRHAPRPLRRARPRAPARAGPRPSVPGVAEPRHDSRQQDFVQVLVAGRIEAGGVHRHQRPARPHEIEVEILLHRSAAGVHRRGRLERSRLIADPAEGQRPNREVARRHAPAGRASPRANPARNIGAKHCAASSRSTCASARCAPRRKCRNSDATRRDALRRAGREPSVREVRRVGARHVRRRARRTALRQLRAREQLRARRRPTAAARTRSCVTGLVPVRHVVGSQHRVRARSPCRPRAARGWRPRSRAPTIRRSPHRARR